MSTWETSVCAETERCEAVEAALETALGEMLLALSRFEDGTAWRVTAHTSSEPDNELLSRLSLALQRDETVVAPIKVPDQDWVAKVQRDMPPIFEAFYADPAHQVCDSCGHENPGRPE